MEIGLRQSSIAGFEKQFPLTSNILRKKLETTFADEFKESGKPEEYKFQLSVEYCGENEEDRSIGELITAPDGRKLYETRTIDITGNYPGLYGRTKIAFQSINLTNPKLELPQEEVRNIETLFDQVKSFPLDSIPKEIQV